RYPPRFPYTTLFRSCSRGSSRLEIESEGEAKNAGVSRVKSHLGDPRHEWTPLEVCDQRIDPPPHVRADPPKGVLPVDHAAGNLQDRKSTRLNSSHVK